MRSRAHAWRLIVLIGIGAALKSPTDRRRALLAIASMSLTAARPAAAADGRAVFEASCAACHEGGKNVVARGLTLDRAALSANGYADADAVAGIVRAGKRQMPGFGAECAPKPACTFGPRLSEEAVSAVAAFVDARADDGRW